MPLARRWPIELRQLRAEVKALRGAIKTSARVLAPYVGNGCRLSRERSRRAMDRDDHRNLATD
jgi:hypothetical protein